MDLQRGWLLCASLVFLSAVCGQIQVRALLELDGETSDPSLSPDGKTLAFDWCQPDYSACGIYTRPLAGGEVRWFAGRDIKEGLTAYPRWSPDGKKIAFTRVYSHFDNHLFVRDFNGGPERDFGVVCDRALEGSWSPDGRFLVASVYTEDPPLTFDCRPILFSAATGMRVRPMAPRGGASAFSPDGRMLAYANGNALVLLRLTVDYRPASPTVTLAREPREISDVSWTRDGRQIIYQAWGDVPYLRRIAARPGARPLAIPRTKSMFSISELLADGSALATATTQVEALWRADLSTTPPKIETVADPGCSAGGPGCSPDGRQQVFITNRTGLSEIMIANADGTNEHPLVKSIPAFADPKDDGVPNLIGWSPDGKWIAFTVFPAHGNADVRSYLYVVPSSGGEVRRLAKEAYAIYAPTWSRDSTSLYGSQGWAVDDRAHDLAHDLQSPIVRVGVAGGGIAQLGADGIWPQVSPDGKFLYFFTSPRPKLFRISMDGGPEERLLNQEDFDLFSYAIGAKYLYLFSEPKRNATSKTYSLVRFDPETQQTVALAEIPFPPRSVHLSSDEHFLYFAQQDDPKRRVVLVHGLF